MAEREWLVAENSSMLVALPRCSVSAMISGVELIELPFSSDFVSGIFLHGGRTVPVFREVNAGFGPYEGDLVVMENDGELLALPVLKVVGFCRSGISDPEGTSLPELFRGTVRFNDRTAAALETEDLYKLAGFI